MPVSGGPNPYSINNLPSVARSKGYRKSGNHAVLEFAHTVDSYDTLKGSNTQVFTLVLPQVYDNNKNVDPICSIFF